MNDFPRHTWTGLRWRKCLSLDTHQRGVARCWPGAIQEQVACGLVHRQGGRIVAEVRRRGGWPMYEEWILENPEPGARNPDPGQKGQETMNDRSDSICKLVPALIAAQRGMGPLLKTETAEVATTKGNYRYRYIDLEGVLDACRPALWDNGLTVIQTTALGGDAGHRLVTTLVHTSGEWIAGEYPLRPVRDDPQGLGSALTYARRYALLSILGLAPEDDDGQAASRAARPLRRDREPDAGTGPGPVTAAESDRRPPPGQREQKQYPHEDGPGQQHQHQGAPKSGKALFAWTREQEQRHEVGLLKYLNNWARLQDYPSRMIDWDAEQVRLAHAEACRKLQAIQDRGDAYEEALSN